MTHLTTADYRVQPWANGRGQTVELWRVEGDGGLRARLSMARVAEDGPFSRFAGIARNLTVIAGPGFRLRGEGLMLDCLPFVPVAFSGEVPVTAEGTDAGPSDDFNVMTADTLPRPEVQVLHHAATLPAGGTLALFALEVAQVNGAPLRPHDLVLTTGAAEVDGLVLVARILGL